MWAGGTRQRRELQQFINKFPPPCSSLPPVSSFLTADLPICGDTKHARPTNEATVLLSPLAFLACTYIPRPFPLDNITLSSNQYRPITGREARLGPRPSALPALRRLGHGLVLDDTVPSPRESGGGYARGRTDGGVSDSAPSRER